MSPIARLVSDQGPFVVYLFNKLNKRVVFIVYRTCSIDFKLLCCLCPYNVNLKLCFILRYETLVGRKISYIILEKKDAINTLTTIKIKFV